MNAFKKIIKKTEPRRLKRKFANPALLAYKDSLAEASNAVLLVPRLPP